MKKKTIKPNAYLFSVSVAGYEPKQFNEYLNKVEKELKQYAKELGCTITCHIEYIPLNYNKAIKDQEFEDKRDIDYKEMDKMFKLPEIKIGLISNKKRIKTYNTLVKEREQLDPQTKYALIYANKLAKKLQEKE